SYWPGGRRPAVGPDCRRPRNPLEMNDSVICSHLLSSRPRRVSVPSYRRRPLPPPDLVFIVAIGVLLLEVKCPSHRSPCELLRHVFVERSSQRHPGSPWGVHACYGPAMSSTISRPSIQGPRWCRRCRIGRPTTTRRERIRHVDD